MKRHAIWPFVLWSALLLGCAAGSTRRSPSAPSNTPVVAAATPTAVATPHTPTASASATPTVPPISPSPSSPTLIATVASTAKPATLLASPQASSAPCRSAQLELALGPNDYSPGTMQRPMGLTLRNRSTEPCSLFGYPQLVRLDAAGKEVPWNLNYGGDQMVTPHPPRRVELAPGGVAYVTLNHTACQRYVDESVTILFIPPGDTQPIQQGPAVPWTMTSVCIPGDPGARVSVSPIAATIDETIAHP